MDIRFVPTVLEIHLSPLTGESDTLYQKEYRILSDFEEDAVGQWLKLAKARGETKDSDEVLMTLLVELHKKVDQLTALVKNEERTLLPLEINENIAEIGFEHIKLENRVLEVGKEYYCRIDMPVFPKREMPMFVKAIDQNIAQITLIHDKDEKDWNAYVTARERIMIREMRAQQ